MSFTDQKPRYATEKELSGRWGGYPNGKRFRCYLCGYKFKLGDYWRWVRATHKGYINFLVCSDCDGDDILDRWIEANRILETKFWWFVDDFNEACTGRYLAY